MKPRGQFSKNFVDQSGAGQSKRKSILAFSRSNVFGIAPANFGSKSKKGKQTMHRFSLVVLENTLELATAAMPPDNHARVAECARIIRQYIDSPYSHEQNQLGPLVMELADLAQQNHEFLISTRLRDFARQFRPSTGKSDVA